MSEYRAVCDSCGKCVGLGEAKDEGWGLDFENGNSECPDCVEDKED